jgi:hypothetical protein
VDALVANTGVGGLTALLEGPAYASQQLPLYPGRSCSLIIPLLAVVGPLSTGGRALVAGVA